MRTVLFGLIAITLIMSIVTFLLMRHDKQCTRQHKRRIPEYTLFLVAGLFGAIGSTIAMQVYRHKTNHWYFRTFFLTMMIVQIAIIGVVTFKVFT